MSGYTYQGIKCGNCSHRHNTPADVKACYQASRDYEAREAQAEYDAEMAIERYYENRGWAEQAAFERWEQDNGAVDFSEALAAAEQQYKADLIRGIRNHAQANYDQGWDIIVEARTDAELVAELGEDFGTAMTLDQAIAKIAFGVEVLFDRYKDIAATAF
jgi:hypothetical protein